MKKFLFSIFAFAVACGVAQAQKTPKVAVVDIPKVLLEYNMAADQRALLNADYIEMQRWNQKEEQELLALRSEAEKTRQQAENPMLNEAGRAEAKARFEQRAKDFQSKQEAYIRGRQDKENALNGRQQQMATNVVEKIRPAIQVTAKEKGVDLVLNSAQNALNVLYADASLDISADIVKKLNAEYGPRVRPDPVPPPPPGAAPVAAPPSAAAPAASAPATPAPATTPAR